MKDIPGRLTSFGVLLLMLSGVSMMAQLQTPALHPWAQRGTVSLRAAWERSSAIVVGDLVEVRAFAVQRVGRGSAPGDILYWCKGKFVPLALVRGTLQGAPLDYVFANVTPGCTFYQHEYGGRPFRGIRVWFLQITESYIQAPTLFGPRLVRFETEWEIDDSSSYAKTFARLLLDQRCSPAIGRSSSLAYEHMDLACAVLTSMECISRLNELAVASSPPLRDAACTFLEGELSQVCPKR